MSTTHVTDRCNAILKSGQRKGHQCNAKVAGGGVRCKLRGHSVEVCVGPTCCFLGCTSRPFDGVKCNNPACGKGTCRSCWTGQKLTVGARWKECYGCQTELEIKESGALTSAEQRQRTTNLRRAREAEQMDMQRDFAESADIEHYDQAQAAQDEEVRVAAHAEQATQQFQAFVVGDLLGAQRRADALQADMQEAQRLLTAMRAHREERRNHESRLHAIDRVLHEIGAVHGEYAWGAEELDTINRMRACAETLSRNRRNSFRADF